jgi:hypothetical protein
MKGGQHMNAYSFRQFSQVIATAPESDPIWWAGWLWLDLTATQVEKAGEILRNRPFITASAEADGRKAYRLPSGLQLICRK